MEPVAWRRFSSSWLPVAIGSWGGYQRMFTTYRLVWSILYVFFFFRILYMSTIKMIYIYIYVCDNYIYTRAEKQPTDTNLQYFFGALFKGGLQQQIQACFSGGMLVETFNIQVLSYNGDPFAPGEWRESRGDFDPFGMPVFFCVGVMCLRWNMDKRPLFLQKTMFGKQILTWVQENQMTIHGNNGKHLEDKELTCLVETLLQGFTGRNGFSWKLKATLMRSIWLNMVLVAYGNSNHPLAFFVVDPFAFRVMKRFKIWENHLERRWRSFHVLVYHHVFLLKPTFLSWNLACPKYRKKSPKIGENWKTPHVFFFALHSSKFRVGRAFRELGSSPQQHLRSDWYCKSPGFGGPRNVEEETCWTDSVIRFPQKFGIFCLMIPQNLWKTGRIVSFFQLELFFCSINGKDQSSFFVEWGGGKLAHRLQFADNHLAWWGQRLHDFFCSHGKFVSQV